MNEFGHQKLSLNNPFQNLLARNSFLSEDDIRALRAYNVEISRGVDPCTAYYRTLTNASAAAVNMASAANGASVNIEAIAKTSKLSTIALKTLSTVMNALAFMAIMKVIQTIIDSINNSILTQEEALEALEESSSAFNEATSEISNLKSQIVETTNRLHELQLLANNGTISITEQNELETLKQTNNELERKLALKQAEQAEKAQKVIEDIGNVDTDTVKSEYKTEYKYGAKQGIQVTISEEVEYAQNEYKKLIEEEAQVEETRKKLALKGDNRTQNDIYDYVSNEDSDVPVKRVLISKSEEKIYQESLSRLEKISEEKKAVHTRLSELYNGGVKEKLDAYRDLKNAGVELKEYQKDYDALIKIEDAYLLSSYRMNQIPEAYKILNSNQKKQILQEKLIEKGLSNEKSSAVLNYINDKDLDALVEKEFTFTIPDEKNFSDVKAYGKAYAEAWLNSIDTTFNDYAITTEFSDIFTMEDSSGTSTILSNLKDNIDKVVNSYQSLKSASKEYQTNGTLSFSTIQSLIESGDDWLNYLNIEDGQLKINEQAYYDMAQAKLYELNHHRLKPVG